MRVHLLHFGPLRDLRGCAEETLELAEPATMADVHVAVLGGTAAAALPVAYIRNEERVGREAVVADGDRLALLPPVGGG